MNTKITGSIDYNGYIAQQHKDAFKVFTDFLSEIKPARILEIGTANGGFILFIRETMDQIGLDSSDIISYDVHEKPWYNELRNRNIQIRIENLFDSEYVNLEYPEKIESFIKSEGITLILCDGGKKISEFNAIAPLIKNGDFIMAHDYVDTEENFLINFKNKIWDWCEIKEKDISKISNEHKLSHYKKEIFDKVAWVCKQKVINP